MTILLAASAGGHLQQIYRLAPRLGLDSENVMWVSYDTPQARSLLGSAQLIRAHHPTTKNLVNAARNYRLARRVFEAHDIARVVSTGAAIAVPFMLRAHQLAIPGHYIESATRTQAPSLTGKLLERLKHVHLYRQTGEWGAPRWHQGPSVFDGYGVAPGDQRVPARVVVSLGTHGYAFPDLVDRLLALLPASAPDVLWQLGSTSKPPDMTGRMVDQLPADELQAEVAAADVVVGHAGVGLALTALAAGKVPLLVPRRKARGEHTDDHQVELARELESRGLAVVAEVGELSFGHLARAASLTVTYEQPPPFELVD